MISTEPCVKQMGFSPFAGSAACSADVLLIFNTPAWVTLGYYATGSPGTAPQPQICLGYGIGAVV